jgi:hypothetical protein
MGETIDIGRRIELVPMDPHFHDISIALYRQKKDEGPAYLVHTYSRIEGVEGRITSIANAMCTLGGLETKADGFLQFPCRKEHGLAIKRVFLEACKLAPDNEIEPRPLHILDKKSGLDIYVTSHGEGVYQVTADGEAKDKDRRISFIAGGLIKLAQLEDQSVDTVAFDCKYAHDAMLGLLLVRAPNVRAVLREQEATASRGVLAAPSQQE